MRENDSWVGWPLGQSVGLSQFLGGTHRLIKQLCGIVIGVDMLSRVQNTSARISEGVVHPKSETWKIGDSFSRRGTDEAPEVCDGIEAGRAGAPGGRGERRRGCAGSAASGPTFDAWRDKVRKGGPAALRGLGRRVSEQRRWRARRHVRRARQRRTSWRRRTGGSPRWSARSASSRSIWIFSASLAACEGERLTQRRAWRRAVYEVVQMMTSAMPQGQVTIERLCRLARVSRAGYYRFWQTSAPRQHDTAARDTIQRLVLANGRYRRGVPLHHRTAAPRRPDRQSQARAAPDARGQSAGSAPAAVRAADDRRRHPGRWCRTGRVTCNSAVWTSCGSPTSPISGCRRKFAYPAIILDAFSRRVVGGRWPINLGASLAAALTMALAARRRSWGSLVDHSDRGVQYACAQYTRLLDAHGIAASMSRVGNPYDNAKAERFIRTLKTERSTAHGTASPRRGGRHRRLHRPGLQPPAPAHSALDYQTPVAFEAEHRARSLATAPLTTVGFQGIRKSTVTPDAPTEAMNDDAGEHCPPASAASP